MTTPVRGGPVFRPGAIGYGPAAPVLDRARPARDPLREIDGARRASRALQGGESTQPDPGRAPAAASRAETRLRRAFETPVVDLVSANDRLARLRSLELTLVQLGGTSIATFDPKRLQDNLDLLSRGLQRSRQELAGYLDAAEVNPVIDHLEHDLAAFVAGHPLGILKVDPHDLTGLDPLNERSGYEAMGLDLDFIRWTTRDVVFSLSPAEIAPYWRAGLVDGSTGGFLAEAMRSRVPPERILAFLRELSPAERAAGVQEAIAPELLHEHVIGLRRPLPLAALAEAARASHPLRLSATAMIGLAEASAVDPGLEAMRWLRARNDDPHAIRGYLEEGGDPRPLRDFLQRVPPNVSEAAVVEWLKKGSSLDEAVERMQLVGSFRGHIGDLSEIDELAQAFAGDRSSLQEWLRRTGETDQLWAVTHARRAGLSLGELDAWRAAGVESLNDVLTLTKAPAVPVAELQRWRAAGVADAYVVRGAIAAGLTAERYEAITHDLPRPRPQPEIILLYMTAGLGDRDLARLAALGQVNGSLIEPLRPALSQVLASGRFAQVLDLVQQGRSFSWALCQIGLGASDEVLDAAAYSTGRGTRRELEVNPSLLTELTALEPARLRELRDIPLERRHTSELFARLERGEVSWQSAMDLWRAGLPLSLAPVVAAGLSIDRLVPWADRFDPSVSDYALAEKIALLALLRVEPATVPRSLVSSTSVDGALALDRLIRTRLARGQIAPDIARFLEAHHLSSLSRYSVAGLARMMNQAPDAGRPLAVITLPRSDANNALGSVANMMDQLTAGYRVAVVEAGTDAELAEAVEQAVAYHGGPVGAMILSGHGSPEGMELGHAPAVQPWQQPAKPPKRGRSTTPLFVLDDSERYLLDRSDNDVLARLQRVLGRDSVVVFVSCSTGKGADSIAEAVAKQLGNVKTYAPTIDTSGAELELDPQTHRISFVKYAAGFFDRPDRGRTRVFN